MQEFSILQARQTPSYRLLEAFLGLASVSFLLCLIICSIFWPTVAAIFLIVYSFFWLLRVTTICLFTIYSYKNLRRWESVEMVKLLANFPDNLETVRHQLFLIQNKYAKSLDWSRQIAQDIAMLEQVSHTKFARPYDLYQIPIFSVYNESPELLGRSLKSIYTSDYPLDKIVVFITQEARLGENLNADFRQKISALEWVSAHNISESDLTKVYQLSHTELAGYEHPDFAKLELRKDKLNVVFTQHPDGLTGEIKGKASNEDWAARQASLFVATRKIDPQMVLLTSLDADSRLGKNYFHLLALRFCLTPDRLQAGFQPIPVYSNNFFDTGLVPRLIATQTTLYQFAQNAIESEAVFFANYSVPLEVARKVNFWVRDGIAEDYLFFAKCFIHFKSRFRVLPFHGVFEGDAVAADDYVEAIVNQYRQLQRWSWGGVESWPYLFYHFFMNQAGRDIPLVARIKLMAVLFANHFFWATTPLFFSVGVSLPIFFGGEVFKSTPAAQNLSNFSSYFASMSIVFLSTFTYITFKYIASKAANSQKQDSKHITMVLLQWLASPFVYGFIGIPALDSQIRGVLGKHLGYWVTPKK